jgi:hypothetical protein
MYVCVICKFQVANGMSNRGVEWRRESEEGYEIRR